MTDIADNSDSIYAFVAKLDKTKQFINLIKALNFQDRVNVTVSEIGLKFTVDEAKSMQMSAFIEKSFFYEFTLRNANGDEEGSPDLSFNISLSTLLIFLSLGENALPHLKICYEGYGNPLFIFLDDQVLTFDSHLNTRDVDYCIDFSFSTNLVMSKIVMVSEMFKDIVSSLTSTSDYITISVNNKSIKFTCDTVYGDSDIEMKCSSEMIEVFTCVSPIKSKFKLSMLKHGLKPLAFSEKVSLRIDNRNFLCIQHLMKVEGEGRGFLEFFCVPDIVDDEN